MLPCQKPCPEFPPLIPGLPWSLASEYFSPSVFISTGLFPGFGVTGAVWIEMSLLLQRAYLSLYYSALVCLNITIRAVKLNQSGVQHEWA